MLTDQGGRERLLAQFVKFIRSRIHFPSSQKIGSELLDEYHSIIEERVQTDFINQLSGGYGTLMFDSSEDENLRPITSVLLRVTGGSRANIKAYYLDTVFTGTTKSDAELYKKIATEATEKWVGFTKMCNIITDNTGNVKKAREDFTKTHGRLVASQDQAHVADKLMQDIGEISWIDNVIKPLSYFAVHYRKYTKVKARLEEKITSYKSNLRCKSALEQSGSGVDRSESNVLARRASTSDEDQIERNSPENIVGNNGMGNKTVRNDVIAYSGLQGVSLLNLKEAGYDDFLQQVREEIRGEEEDVEDTGSDTDPSESQGAPFQVSGSFSDSESSAGLFTSEIPGFAKTTKRMSRVRFGSAEKLLGVYRFVRMLLTELVHEPDFACLCSFRTESDKNARDEFFIKPILDDELFRNVLQAHGILGARRTYLRVFDKETALISEVYEATRILEQTLNCLPLNKFPEPHQENRDHLMHVFQNRKEGPLPGMKRVRITLLENLHYAAALLDPFRFPCDNMNAHSNRFRRHLDDYFAGEEPNVMQTSNHVDVERCLD